MSCQKAMVHAVDASGVNGVVRSARFSSPWVGSFQASPKAAGLATMEQSSGVVRSSKTMPSLPLPESSVKT